MAFVPKNLNAVDDLLLAEALATTAGAFILDDAHPLAAFVDVFGEATFADTAAFGKVVAGAVAVGRLVVIDLNECTYMDCAAIGVIVHAAKELRDRLRLVMSRAGQSYRILDITGLTRVLHIFETRSAAVDTLREAPPRLRLV